MHNTITLLLGLQSFQEISACMHAWMHTRPETRAVAVEMDGVGFVIATLVILPVPSLTASNGKHTKLKVYII